jgi:hypothetical protein
LLRYSFLCLSVCFLPPFSFLLTKFHPLNVSPANIILFALSACAGALTNLQEHTKKVCALTSFRNAKCST